MLIYLINVEIQRTRLRVRTTIDLSYLESSLTRLAKLLRLPRKPNNPYLSSNRPTTNLLVYCRKFVLTLSVQRRKTECFILCLRTKFQEDIQYRPMNSEIKGREGKVLAVLDLCDEGWESNRLPVENDSQRGLKCAFCRPIHPQSQ